MQVHINQRLEFFKKIDSIYLNKILEKLADSILMSEKKRGKILLFGNQKGRRSYH